MRRLVIIKWHELDRDPIGYTSMLKRLLHCAQPGTDVVDGGDLGTLLGIAQSGSAGPPLKDLLAGEQAISLSDGRKTPPRKILSER